MAFIFLPKITIGFSGSLDMNQILERAREQLEDRKGTLPTSASLMHQGKGLWDLASSSVCLGGPELGRENSLANSHAL